MWQKHWLFFAFILRKGWIMFVRAFLFVFVMKAFRCWDREKKLRIFVKAGVKQWCHFCLWLWKNVLNVLVCMSKKWGAKVFQQWNCRKEVASWTKWCFGCFYGLISAIFSTQFSFQATNGIVGPDEYFRDEDDPKGTKKQSLESKHSTHRINSN